MSTNPGQQITDDLLEAFVVEATANETAILEYADGLLVAGSNTVASALDAAFKAKVPLAGGAIGNALTTAIGTLDLDVENALKVGFDQIVAKAQAKELQPPTS